MKNRRPFKLTAVQVAEIRSLSGNFSQTEIAQRFEVARATISDIVNGRTWG